MKSAKALSLLLIVLLCAGFAGMAHGAEQSACITCHVDENMLVRNLSKTEAKTSSMQSGSG